jgi:hypothetical protein
VKYLCGISSIFESVDFLKLHVDKQDLVQPRPSAPGCTACRSSCSSLPVLGDLEAAGILRPERQVPSIISSAFLRSAVPSQVRGERGVKNVNLMVLLVIFLMGRTLSR